MNLRDQLLEQASTIVEETQEFDQPTLTEISRFRVKQANSVNAPEDAEDGWFYDKSGMFGPVEEITATFSDCEESMRLSTKYEKPEPHCVCLAPVKSLATGIPFIPTQNGNWIPGQEQRDCSRCPYNMFGRATPKLGVFEEPNLDDNMCKSFFTWQLLLMQDLDDVNGTPFLLEYGSSFFMKEYRNLAPFMVDDVLYFSWHGIVRQMKKGKLMTIDGEVPIKFQQLQRLKLSVRTTKIKLNNKVNYAPVFGVVGIWTETEDIFASIRHGRELLPLHSPTMLALDAGEYDEAPALSEYNDDPNPYLDEDPI